MVRGDKHEGTTIDSYAVRITGPARRALHRLPEKVMPAVVEFITGPLAANPYRVGARLRFPPYEGFFAGRVGPGYRVRYEIDEDAVVVTGHDVDRRADVYRP